MKFELQQKIAKIFLNIIGTEFKPGIQRKSLSKWDSLNHVRLMVSIEKQFNLKFTSFEAISISSTDDLINLLSLKL